MGRMEQAERRAMIGKLTRFEPSDGLRARMSWDDGSSAAIDFAPIIVGHPVLSPLADPGVFKAVRLSADGWSIEWACGIDFGAAQLRTWASALGSRAPAA